MAATSGDDRRARARPESVTDDELEVMRLVAEGHKDIGIARRLRVAPVTVRRRAQRFTRKLGARNRAHAIALAMTQGWFEPTGDEDDGEA